jgi:2-polyprenyl-3-methyl-5-hydroxy-6-metoxy-1,4-benzoquinol methylase
VVGADIDARHVKVAQALLPSEPLGHEPQIEMRRLDVTLGADRALVQGIEFIALSEVIQQISDRDWIANVFKLNPDILVVTTPNREFNVNYPDILLCENGLRDPEHAFEFTQSEFIDWARERAGRSNYAVDILPLGPADTAHGPASLMAVFQKHPDTTGKLLVGARQAARSSIIKTATDPHQYDSPEVLWTQEGSATSPNRRLFLEYLRPAIGEMPGKRVLDVGCGLGWLSHEIAQSGGRPLGIDPSMRCLSGARQAFPDLTFQQAALQDFQPETRFDAAFMIMVDNFMDATDVFDGVRRHLHPDGQFIMVTADFEHSLSGHNHRLEYEVINEDAVAIRLENKDRFGVLCDIVHPVHAYLRSAAESGFTLYQHTTIIPRRWHPRYDTHQGKALFHLLEFTKNNPLKGIPGSPN